jgi:glycyl-tRNA synthetase beta chain
MAELLLEILSEEIPARMQLRAADDLARLMGDALKKEGLAFDRCQAFATPRRLALAIDGLPTAQPDIREERKGPRVDAPEKAIDGFLGSVGLSRDQVVEMETKKGTFLMAVIEKAGRPTADVIADIVPEIIRNFPWPKSQRWGSGTLNWVRPLQGIVCLLDDTVIDLEVDGTHSGNATLGHRFMAPGDITVSGFDDLEAKLNASKVILRTADRKQMIADAIASECATRGLDPIEDDGLLTEVAGLVEWPVVLMGSIDQAFMDVPEEALISAIKKHQKYLTFRDPKTGKLAPYFAVVANLEASDGGAAIVDGNERVLRARLADTKFFWDQDLKNTLESRVGALDSIVFHAKLGTVGDKIRRVAGLAGYIAELIGADAPKASRAASLAKADLTTGMVGEFADLQGLMGQYYAVQDGEDAAVAAAIGDHYKPQGPGDSCPSAPETVAVALADKIDTLVGFFNIDERPTGSKDPFALRRAALGVIRLVLENNLRIDLPSLLEKAGADGDVGLMGFFADRLKVHLREQRVRHDLVSAVFALGGEGDLVRLMARVNALQGFIETDAGADMLAAYRRAANIVRIEEKKSETSFDGSVEEAALKQDEEKTLFAELGKAVGASSKAVGQEAYADAMAAIATLRGPVDAFFDKVTVNADDPALRENRLKLLSSIGSTLDQVADFSVIEG